MIATVVLPLPLQEQLCAETLSVYPRECCGLIEGIAEGEIARVVALHPIRNVAEQTDRFEIDPAAQIALLRNLRGSGHAIIGCYHSHPNGRAEPSARDRESATEPDFLWLICAVEARHQTPKIAAFLGGLNCFSVLKILHDRPGTAGLRRAEAASAVQAGVLARTVD